MGLRVIGWISYTQFEIDIWRFTVIEVPVEIVTMQLYSRMEPTYELHRKLVKDSTWYDAVDDFQVGRLQQRKPNYLREIATLFSQIP